MRYKKSKISILYFALMVGGTNSVSSATFDDTSAATPDDFVLVNKYKRKPDDCKKKERNIAAQPSGLSTERVVTIPTPIGNLGYSKLPDVMCPDAMSEEDNLYNFFPVGTLVDDEEQIFSFETAVVQQKTKGSVGYGFRLFQLAFEKDGCKYYVNSIYGGESQVLQAIAQSISWIKTAEATTDNLCIQAYPVVDTNKDSQPVWQFATSKTATPIPPLFTGKVGQPGHQYTLTGTGRTFLWQYDPNGKATVFPYYYTFGLNLLDERGVVAEGYGGGAWGRTGTNSSSFEISQPRLQVTNWSIDLNPVETTLPGMMEYSLKGHEGMLWNDIQFYQIPTQKQFGLPRSRFTRAISSIPKLIQSELPVLAQTCGALRDKMTEVPMDAQWSLYNGNWVVTQFNKGRYKGASMIVAVFWNKTDPAPKDQDTDNAAWCTNAIMCLYTGILPYDTASSYTISDTLLLGNPDVMPQPLKRIKPFRFECTGYADMEKYNLLFPWLTEARITIQPNTQIRRALASYAERQDPDIEDDVNQAIMINLKTISPVAQNITFTKQNSQAYECAAVVTEDEIPVGTGWIEHMVNLPSAK